MLGKKSAEGSFNLFLGVVTQSIILAIGAVVVGRLLGSDLYGLYTLAFIPATFVGLFVGIGIRNATIRYAARYSHHNQQKKVKETIIAGLFFTALIAALLTILCFSLSSPISKFFGRPDASFLIQIMSLTIFSDGLILGFQSVFIGLERTDIYSLMLICAAILKACLGPLLLLMVWAPSSFGPFGVVIGYATASYLTCIVGLSISYLMVIRRLSPSSAELELWKRLKIMLSYGIPLYISRVVTGFLTQFLRLMMAIYASNILIGNYKVSSNFTVLISFFAIPIATVLFPAFSKLDCSQNKEAIERVFRTSVKYTSIFVLPVTILVITLSEPAVFTLYGSDYELSPFFLALSALTFLYSGLGQLSISAILNGQGETRKNMILGLVKVAVGLPLSVLLVPIYQITGLIIASLLSEFPSILIGSFWVKKLYDALIDWRATIKIFIASLAAGLAAFGSRHIFILPSLVQLGIGTAIFLTVFIVLAPTIGAINSEDITNLRMIFNEIGPASSILNIPLRIMSKLCRIKI